MWRPVWQVLRDAAIGWSDDRASSMGASLSYYTLFSLAPLLLIVISVAALVFGEQAARDAVLEQMAHMVGPESAGLIDSALQRLNQPQAGRVGTAVGLLLLLVGATTVFAELQESLDRIWRAPPPPHTSRAWWRLLRTRLLSLGMVLGIGFLSLVSLVVTAALAALDKWWAPHFGPWLLLAQAANLLLSLGFITAMFAMLYKWMPRVNVAWRDVWLGAAVTALLFSVGKYAIGAYIGRSGVASAFGAAASLVVLLLWVYYSAQIFLFGAELTAAYARRHGSLAAAARAGAAEAAPEAAARGG